MRQRTDLVALHEPLEGLAYIGPLTVNPPTSGPSTSHSVDVEPRTFDSPDLLVEWLLDGSAGSVFLKETLAPPVVDLVRSNQRFLAEVRHAFLIRRPQEIASSFLALEGDLRIHASGVAALHSLYEAVREAGGHRPVVVDSDDLVARPELTMRAYCDAVGLPFDADALRWEPGVQPEWERTARWHEEASASTGFFQPSRPDRHGLASHPEVVRFVERHQPFYDLLRANRLRIDRPNADR